MKGNFNNIISSGMPVLVDFYAEWCGPCKVQSPILVDVAGELNGKVKVIKIDVDRNPEIAGRYQIRGVPTLILFKNGQIIWRQSGVADRANLINTLKNHI